MKQIMAGRFTALHDEPFVVFLIGMRINKLLAFTKWLPVMRAMPPMLKELYQHPELGFLGAELLFYWPGVASLQYWRSFEDLERFAHSPNEPHLSAWRSFNRAVGSDGTVGIWHETYLIEPGHHEAIYGNMPTFGLAAATSLVPAKGRRSAARQRLGSAQQPATPAPVAVSVE
ncbi:MAG: DUF4188 domain-containing protein [Chloroflexaceae bacterium]|jgi:hypothetical protein|nr:DUF4188 domain-containing protein [Chloroflexaceae bacterium]